MRQRLLALACAALILAAAGHAEALVLSYDFAGITSPSSTHSAEVGEIDLPSADIAAGSFGARRDTIPGWTSCVLIIFCSSNWSELGTPDYADIAAPDGSLFTTPRVGTGDNAAMLFEFETGQAPATVSRIDVGLGAAQLEADGFLFAFLWNYATGSYTPFASITGTGQQSLGFSVTSGAGDYVDASGQLTLFLVNQATETTIIPGLFYLGDARFTLDDASLTLTVPEPDPAALIAATAFFFALTSRRLLR